jgi:hypothetical protein
MHVETIVTVTPLTQNCLNPVITADFAHGLSSLLKSPRCVSSVASDGNEMILPSSSKGRPARVKKRRWVCHRVPG